MFPARIIFKSCDSFVKIRASKFATRHQMEAEDNGGDSAELWITLNACGYNVALRQDECALFEVTLRSERGEEGEARLPAMEVSGLKSGGSVLDKACNKCVMDGSRRTRRHLDKNEEICVFREVRALALGLGLLSFHSARRFTQSPFYLRQSRQVNVYYNSLHISLVNVFEEYRGCQHLANSLLLTYFLDIAHVDCGPDQLGQLY